MRTNGKCNNSHAPSTGLSGILLTVRTKYSWRTRIWKNINTISMHREKFYQLHIETTTVWPACSVLQNIHGCKSNLKYWNSNRFKTWVVDLEVHQHIWLNRYVAWASFTIAHTSLNDSKCILEVSQIFGNRLLSHSFIRKMTHLMCPFTRQSLF